MTFTPSETLGDRATEKRPLTGTAADDLETVEARGRAEWLNLRHQAAVKSPTSNPTRARDSSKRSESELDSGKSLDDDASE